MKRYARSAIALSSILAACVLSQGCANPDGPDPTDTKPVVHPTVGTVLVQNYGYDLVNVTITDSSGYPTLRSIPPGLKVAVTVVPGVVHVQGVTRATGATVISQDLTVVANTRTAVKAPALNYVVPAQLFATDYQNKPIKAGTFTCTSHGQAYATDPVSQGGVTTASITCQDPSDPSHVGLHSLTFVYNDSDFANAARKPQPYSNVLDTFNTFTNTRSLGAFQVVFNNLTAAPSTASDPAYFALAPFDPILHPINPVVSPPPPQIPTQFGQLTIDHAHQDSSGGGYPSTHTYDTEQTLYVGSTKNSVTFRYQLDLDPSQTVTGYDFQIAMFADQALISDPCANALTPTGWVYLRSVPIQMSKEGGFVITGEFTQELDHLKGPATFYARVVPVQAVNGISQCVGGPSNWVSLVQSTDDPNADVTSAMGAKLAAYTAAQDAASANDAYQVTVLSYQPEGFGGDSQAYRRLLIAKDDNPNGWPMGCAYLAQEPPPSPPWYDQALSGILDALSYLAEVYDDLKAAVIDIVADAIPGCTSSPGCKGALTAGLDTGLAFLGLPPDIPNLDQLIQNGGDFIAGVASDAVTDATGLPVPQAAAQQLTNQMVSQVQGALTPPKTDKYDPYSWGRPDPYWALTPAMLWIKVTRDPDPSKNGGGNIAIDNSAQGIWTYRTISMPTSLQPGGSMILPIVLQPNLKELPDPTENQTFNEGAELSQWYINDYKAGTAPLHFDIQSGHYNVTVDTTTGAAVGSYGAITEAPSCQ